ncbi:hypothetical protein BaRGS_00015042, partial [Batillaria attramentaria]
MKCVAVCLTLCAVVLGQDMLTTSHATLPDEHHLTLEWAVRAEIRALLARDVHHVMTVAQCAETCDAEFHLTGFNPERVTKHLCQTECERRFLTEQEDNHIAILPSFFLDDRL